MTADARTDDATVILTDRTIVPLTADIAEQATHSKALQLVTPITSRITLPLRALINAGKARWIVRHQNGYYDGLTGRPMTWNNAFVPTPNAQDYAPGYKTPPTALGVHLTFVARAQPTFIEPLTRLLTNEPPKGWGPTEPVQHPWTSQLPAGTRIITVGTHCQALTDSTTTTLTVAYADTPPLERLPTLLTTLYATHPFQSLLVHVGNGRPDLTTEPRWIGTPTPVGLALGRSPISWFPLTDWPSYQQLLQRLRGSASGSR
ncbi:DUF6177 family protein [Actinomadura rugatobispora]|uniref:DUF6177 family protein n=1 Tax=Actinomadura rugatobispora TaxID=1994 RepID=A0ABW1A9H7_9ACTN